MKFIQGNSRTQAYLFPVSLNQAIEPDNEVRLIDLFVDSLPLADYGFNMEFVENGRPAYHSGDLLKLIQATVQVARHFKLIGGGLIAGDIQVYKFIVRAGRCAFVRFSWLYILREK